MDEPVGERMLARRYPNCEGSATTLGRCIHYRAYSVAGDEHAFGGLMHRLENGVMLGLKHIAVGSSMDQRQCFIISQAYKQL